MPKILIVDDDPVIRNLLEQILEPFEEHGVELMTADNGVAALEVVRSARPEVIFLDVMMPRMNGFEVCKIVKNDPDIANCYVVMLTAKGQEVDKQKAKEIGVDCYITKPFNITELVGKVSEVMGIKIKWGS